MKKITFLFFLLTASLGFSQELVVNGDFESGEAPWYGNALNVQTDGGNSYNFADVATAGNAFDVNLSQGLTLVQGEVYELKFDASTSAGNTRTMVAGIGLAVAPFSADVQEVTLTETTQTFTLTLTAAGFGGSDSRVLFDMGADTGIVVIDNVSLILQVPTCTDGIQNGDETGVDCGGSCPDACPDTPEPSTAAPTPPARDASAVISIYGDAYGAPVGLNNVPWDDPTVFNEVNIAGNDVLAIDFDTFMGSSLGTVVDASAMTHFHMDFWVADDFTAGQVFNPKLSNHQNGSGETDAYDYTYAMGPSDIRTWVSIDVPLSAFAQIDGDMDGDVDRANITEFLITVAGLLDRAYVDNIYLHNDTVLSVDDFELAQMSVYPNPSENKWTFKSENTQISSVNIFNVLGKRVLSMEPKSNNFDIDGSRFSKGIYLARIESANGTKTIKLVKE